MNSCLAQVQACAIRVARLEPNGVPDPGANNLYVSDALTILTVTPEIVEGDEVEVKNACGGVRVNYKDQDRIKRLNVELTLCVPDPELHELLAGGSVLSDGTARGYAYPQLNDSSVRNGVSIELWARQITSDGASDGTYPYAWWVLPRVYLTPGARTFENGAQLSPFTGFALENPNWFDGPANDWPEDSDRALQWIETDSVPTPSCGYQTLAVS